MSAFTVLSSSSATHYHLLESAKCRRYNGFHNEQLLDLLFPTGNHASVLLVISVYRLSWKYHFSFIRALPFPVELGVHWSQETNRYDEQYSVFMSESSPLTTNVLFPGPKLSSWLSSQVAFSHRPLANPSCIPQFLVDPSHTCQTQRQTGERETEALPALQFMLSACCQPLPFRKSHRNRGHILRSYLFTAITKCCMKKKCFRSSKMKKKIISPYYTTKIVLK